MAAETLVTINGIALPNPTKYNTPMVDMDSPDSSRNTKGVMIRNRVRQGAIKIELDWTELSTEAMTLINSIEDEELTVRYLDVRTGSFQTRIMMVSDRSVSMKRYTGVESLSQILWDINFSLVEY